MKFAVFISLLLSSYLINAEDVPVRQGNCYEADDLKSFKDKYGASSDTDCYYMEVNNRRFVDTFEKVNSNARLVKYTLEGLDGSSLRSAFLLVRNADDIDDLVTKLSKYGHQACAGLDRDFSKARAQYERAKQVYESRKKSVNCPSQGHSATRSFRQ